jgi:flagellar hook-basal body complex protein FliE
MNVTSIQSLASKPLSAARPAESVVGAGSFGAMLADFGNQAVSSLRASEATSVAALQGQASVQDVVMKTMAAEQSLQAAIAVRDKLVSALNDLTHMQI